MGNTTPPIKTKHLLYTILRSPPHFRLPSSLLYAIKNSSWFLVLNVFLYAFLCSFFGYPSSESSIQ